MKHALGIAAVLSTILPTVALGQLTWETPATVRPGAPSGLSVFLIDANPGGGLGAMATWRRSPAPVGVGFRVGVAEGPGDSDASGLIGLDISGSIVGIEGPGEPQLLWWTGAGVGFGDEVLASIPLGIMAGWQASEDGVSFAPYAGGHVVLDVRSGPGEDLDLDAAVDVGLDLTFQSNFMVRFAATFGGRDAIAIGMRVPTGR